MRSEFLLLLWGLSLSGLDKRGLAQGAFKRPREEEMDAGPLLFVLNGNDRSHSGISLRLAPASSLPAFPRAIPVDRISVLEAAAEIAGQRDPSGPAKRFRTQLKTSPIGQAA
jgi:hypothetical protein